MRPKRAKFLLCLSCAFASLSGGACADRGPSARLAAMGLEEKAAQVLLIGVEGSGRPSADTEALLAGLPVGGVVLFGFNLPPEPAGAGIYTAALQEAAARAWGPRGDSRSDSPIPLIIAVDHEGGSVFRFKGTGITRIPPPSEVGARDGRYAGLLGRIAGAELRALGFNMALAPVVELLDDENKRFLGSRSYGRDPGRVDAAAGAYIEGLQSELVAAVAKHFPGNAGEDPHKVLPELGLSREEYERDCLPRFSSAIGRKVSTVMLSHVVLPALDPGRPASLSPALIRGELRGRLGFAGLALTDDLGMRALSSTYSPSRSAVAALAAGADLLMLADMREATRVRDAIVAAARDGRLPEARLDEAVRRVLELKARFGMERALDAEARARALAAFPALVREDEKRLKAFRGAPMINE
jgi:beta-N-acetylhexosaminidase